MNIDNNNLQLDKVLKPKKNIFLQLKQYFILSTKEITLLAFFIALYFILGVISESISFVWPTTTAANFLKLEFTGFIFLIIASFYNFFYVSFSIIICSFLRIPNMAFPISNLSLIIVDLVLVFWFYFFNFFVIKRIKINRKISNFLLAFLIVIFSSVSLCLINKWFLLKLYVIVFPSFSSALPALTSNDVIWTVFFVFNLVNFSINLTIFILCDYLIIHFKVNEHWQK